MDREILVGGRRRAFFAAAAAIALFLMMSASAWAQSSLSTIHGTVKDESGAAMPGVTVTLTSPALQVPQLTAVSDAEDRKSTRLNSSHMSISYAVFCLKKKTNRKQ